MKWVAESNHYGKRKIWDAGLIYVVSCWWKMALYLPTFTSQCYHIYVHTYMYINMYINTSLLWWTQSEVIMFRQRIDLIIRVKSFSTDLSVTIRTQKKVKYKKIDVIYVPCSGFCSGYAQRITCTLSITFQFHAQWRLLKWALIAAAYLHGR